MVDMYRTLDSIPVLAKAGGILVMTDEIRGTEAEKNPESLNIRVFPGADGSFRLYEDDNETCAYENGACVFTEMDYKEKDQAVFTIHPAQGKTELIPAKRAYTVEFCNFAKTGTDTVKLREGWSIRTAISGKIDPGSGHAFLETVGFTWDVADSHSVDVVEYEWNLSTVPCGFSPVNRELISKLVGIGRCFRKL